MTALAFVLPLCVILVCASGLLAYRWTLDSARWALEYHHKPPQADEVAALHGQVATLRAEVDTLRANRAFGGM